MKILLATVVVGLAFVGGAQAAARPLAYHTDHQAELYLEHRLAEWGGIDLRKQDMRFAGCMNGYYSKVEHRSGRHFPQSRVDAAGENLFHSFSCTLGAAGHSFNLYVVALPHWHWSVKADR